jgi:8-oxo-dGTP pyrophosphatase MutT (NUDIX family)
VFVEQYRTAAGGRVMSNVAGGISWGESPLAAADRELREELALTGPVPFTYTLLAPKPLLATPGLTNERVFMVRAELRVASVRLPSVLALLHNKQAGVEAEGESIVTHVVPAQEARRFILAQPILDAKTLLSLGLAGL